MKAPISWAGALVVGALAASLASAADYWYPVSFSHFHHAPAPCGPGYCASGYCPGSPGGMAYGANPYGPMPPTPFVMGPPPIVETGREVRPWPTNPYVRGPRDFFMWRENMEDQTRRNIRPNLVP